MTFVEEAGIWFGELFSLLFPTGRLLRWFSLGLVEVVFDEFVIIDDFDEGIWGGGVVIRHTRWTVNASLTSLASSKRRTSFKMAVFSNNFPAYTNLKINETTKCKLLFHQKVIIRRGQKSILIELLMGKIKWFCIFKLQCLKTRQSSIYWMSNLFTINTYLHTLKQDTFFISKWKILTHQNWSKQHISTILLISNHKYQNLTHFQSGKP